MQKPKQRLTEFEEEVEKEFEKAVESEFAEIEELNIVNLTGTLRRISKLKGSSEEVPACSRCGAEMKLRTGNFKSFWGCSNFPSCKVTRRT